MISQKNYRNIRDVIHPEIARLPSEQLEAVLETHHIDAESMEEWLGALVGALPSILPAVGQIAGRAFGGQGGSALGGSIGQLAGGVLGGLTGQRSSPSSPLPQAPNPPTTQSGGPLPGASPAAGHLLQTLIRPETIQALISMLMGQLGRPNVAVGGTQVPVGAFTNLLGGLANQAASEYNAGDAAANEQLPEYLRDYSGEALGDPAVSQQRASVLLHRLREAAFEEERAELESTEHSGETEHHDHDSATDAESGDSLYDAMDLAEMNNLIQTGDL